MTPAYTRKKCRAFNADASSFRLTRQPARLLFFDFYFAPFAGAESERLSGRARRTVDLLLQPSAGRLINVPQPPAIYFSASAYLTTDAPLDIPPAPSYGFISLGFDEIALMNLFSPFLFLPDCMRLVLDGSNL